MLLSWNTAAIMAASLIVLSFVAPRIAAAASRDDRPAGMTIVVSALAKEAGIILSIYSLWQFAGEMAINQVTGATNNAMKVWRFERAVHLPSEVSVQRIVLPHPLLTEFLNAFYAIVHVPALIVFLLWLYFRHRDSYSRWRNIGALLTGACVLVQMIPVAPPRLMPRLGFVDTAVKYGESVYGPGGIRDAPQLAAMPSVHVGWAVFIAVAVIVVSTSRWRWLVIAHPALTIFTVVATANHWWLDGIVACGLFALAMLAEFAASAIVARVRHATHAAPAPVPAPVAAPVITPLPEPALVPIERR